MVAPILDEIAKEYAGQLIVAKVNTDENPGWATRFGVRGIPHVAIIDAEGKVRFNGLHPSATPLEAKAKMIDGLLAEAGLRVPAT